MRRFAISKRGGHKKVVHHFQMCPNRLKTVLLKICGLNYEMLFRLWGGQNLWKLAFDLVWLCVLFICCLIYAVLPLIHSNLWFCFPSFFRSRLPSTSSLFPWLVCVWLSLDATIETNASANCRAYDERYKTKDRGQTSTTSTGRVR